ncbi:MAG: VWA domain-containing protein [Thermodesulfobacteriota bacterium]
MRGRGICCRGSAVNSCGRASSEGGRSRETGLPGQVVLFARLLKERGFKAFSSGVEEALRGLDQIDISVKEDFFAVLRATLVCSDLEWHLFPELFRSFWFQEEKVEKETPPGELWEEEAQKGRAGGEILVQESAGKERSKVEEDLEREFLEGVSYSPVSVVEQKDLGRFQTADIPVAQLALKNLISPFRPEASRRRKRSSRPGDMDFRRVMRKGLRSEGIPLVLYFKRRRKRLKRMVVLADVSGSMDRYARFVMPFILGLRGISWRAEVFVFSTSLTPVTSILKRHGVEDVLEAIAREVPDWSGGTRIGYSLHQFNRRYGKRHLNRRTVVVILSDGWDLGARSLLLKEMESLSNQVHAVIWLNPLAGDPGYAPLLRAMEDLLPYLDYLLPADSLQSLKRVGRTLAKVMTG